MELEFKFDFTEQKLKELLPNIPNAGEWYESMCEVLPKYEINTVERVAAFIAQCSHESGGFKLLQENLNYKTATLTKVWPKRFPADIAPQYGGKPQAIANRAYGGRMGNGDEASGDGYKYRGRGLIQLTGKDNYTSCSNYLFNDDTLVKNPDLVAEPKYALESACWFWKKNNLNQQADTKDIKTMTKKINGGEIGLDDRIKHYNHAIEVLTD